MPFPRSSGYLNASALALTDGRGFRHVSGVEVVRLRRDVFEQLAPATEGPVVNPGREPRRRRGFGDATE